MQPLFQSFSDLMGALPIFYIALGSVLGVTVGAIPGLGAAMLISLMLPLTYYMDSTIAIIFLVSIYVGSVTGGLISATLLRMPGTPSAIMTTLDGYPMAMKGQAGRALSLGIFASFVGGLISWGFLALLSPPLAKLALGFGPYEYLALVIMALVTISAVSSGSLMTGLIGAMIGFAIAMVGPDVASATMRLTFDSDALNTGFRLLPTLLGVFVISQVIEDILDQKPVAQQASARLRDVMPRLGDTFRHGVNLIRSSVIGTWIGILPGVGSAVAAIVSYSVARTSSKTPEEFGTGSEEGIVAAESANNASVNGALVPLIALGIPGSVVDAILIGALTIHDLQPGPGLFTNRPEVAYGVITSAFIANIFVFILMLLGSGLIARLCTIPKSFLLPSVVFFCVVGVYSSTSSMFDVWVMFAFGIFGYALRRFGIPIGTFVLGYILAPIGESELRQGLMLYDGSLAPLFTRPFALGFLFIALFMAVGPKLVSTLRKQRATAGDRITDN
ncbi:tripartite tricarboxylate transporter permease [Maritimibacter dapengensis]|uniref:Tripartite tricarboxylate transporter permease n=1 Tax=Maritimibacter dapengensis TaxID=2836868 RepID=A0ABS6SXB0_9RHOB|nr:tripartite tricarboxylate transporter permease [Maritimibacter dapengensis]MBV7377599.1 tripartite tricarboxylate transporter permease [Maritimibacter dapengensis]